MRSLRESARFALLCGALLAGGCTTRYVGNSPRELELAHDDGRPAQRPVLPVSSYELLLKQEPNLPAYRLLRLRFLVAQPGRLVLNVYDNGPTGKPGKLLHSIDRSYGAEVTSNGSDGKWVVETLPELPLQRGPLWVGLGVSDITSEARVWASSNDSGAVFQRDTQEQTAIMSTPVHYTPMVRLAVQPE